MKQPAITVTFAREDALVLEAFLSEFADHVTFKTLDQAYRMALYRLHATLEHTVEDRSHPDYPHLLNVAKAVLRGQRSESATLDE